MVDRPPLDAVVFDAGGTLVRLDFEWIAMMLGELGVRTTIPALRQGEVHGRRLYDAAADLAPAAVAPIEAYWGGMLERAGCPREQLDVAITRLDERQRSSAFLWARPVEGATGVLAALTAMGLRLACVSNSDGRAEEHLVRFDLRAPLEFVIDSHIVGIEKPDPRIFARALERLGVEPGRALYVGDLRSVDERGARAAGMHFVLLDPYGTYAHHDTDSIPALDRLPAWVAGRFLTPGAGERRHSQR